jgi:hypothetical protein
MMPAVEVYYFAAWNQMQGDNVLSMGPATLAAIRVRDGTPLPATMLVVDSGELDDNGFLKPNRMNRSQR